MVTDEEMRTTADAIDRLGDLYEAGKISLGEWIDGITSAQLSEIVERLKEDRRILEQAPPIPCTCPPIRGCPEHCAPAVERTA